MPIVAFRDTTVVFGKKAARARALSLLDQGMGRREICEKTGAMLGAAGVNLSVHEGEVSVLMGLSGSGKSTLLRAINGLNPIARGSVMVRSPDHIVNVASCDRADLRRLRRETISMVFQSFGLFPWRTVRENVGFGLEVAGKTDAVRTKAIEQQLALVELSDWADKYVHELSGGMQQRVGLARAFATQAPILLMDEPFSALDPLIRGKLQDALRNWQKLLKKTIIFVSHDLEEALKLGTTISIMQDGLICQTGSPEDIILNPATPYVADFVANVNPLVILTAWNVMEDRRDLIQDKQGWLWLDESKSVRLKLDKNGKYIMAERNRKRARWLSCCEESMLALPSELLFAVDEEPVLYHARPQTPLKTIMRAMQKNNAAPVALFDSEERFIGAVKIRNILTAMLKQPNLERDQFDGTFNNS